MNKVFSKSKWIWLKECKANQYADFIVTEKDAKLRISADSDYEAYVNGHFVYAGQYPDYPHYKIYDEFDVGVVCKEGENTLAVRCRYVGEDTSTYRREQAGLLFEIESLGNSDFLFRTIPRKRTIGRRAFRRALPSKNHANFFPAPISVLYSKSAAARRSFRRATLY